MPIAGYNFTPQEITVRFRAPYISQSLNQQYRGAVSTGVYEGFDPTNSLAAFELVLRAGPAGRSTAIATSPTDLSTNISVHLDFDLPVDLTAFANKLVAVVVDLVYAFPSETFGKINIYDLGVETVPPESCVLAEVQVPAAGPIPLANITAKGRSFPWVSRGRDATPMVSVVRNGGPFLTRDFVGLPDFWDQAALAGMSFAASNAVTAPSGFDLTFRASKTLAGVGAVTGVLLQKVGLPIPANRRVRISGDYRALVAPSAGAPALDVVITDKDGATLVQEFLPLTPAAIGVWTSFSTTVLLPALTTVAAILTEVRASLNAVTYTTGAPNTPVFDLANIDVQLEQATSATDVLPEISGESHHTKVRIYESPFPGASYAQITFDGSTTLLSSSIPSASHTFEIDGNLLVDEDFIVTGDVVLSGDTFLSNIDAPPPVDSGPISVGAVNATEVVLGRASRNVRVVDTLLVNTALNPLSAKLNVVGGLSQSGGGVSVDASPFPVDLVTSDVINIYTTGSGEIYLTTDTGGITIQSASGPAFMLGAAGAVLWSGTTLPLAFTGDVMIGSELGVGGVSIFAGGQPPNAPTNALLISALTTVNIGSATLPAAVVEAVDISLNADQKLRLIGETGTLIWTGTTPPASPVNFTSIGSQLGTAGISIRAGGTPIAPPGPDDLLLRAGDDVDIRAGDRIDVGAGGSVIVSSSGAGSSAQLITIGANAQILIQASGPGSDIVMGAARHWTVQALEEVAINAILPTSSILLYAGGVAPANSPGDVLIGNEVGTGGISIFAGGTGAVPTPGTNQLRLGAAGAALLTSAFDLDITTTGVGGINLTSADSVVVTATGQVGITATLSVTISSGSAQDIVLNSNDDIVMSAINDILIGGIVATRRRPGGVAFDIGPITPLRSVDVNLPDATGVDLPTIDVLRGLYNIKAMAFCDGGASTTSVDLVVTPSIGNVSGSVVNAVRGAAPNQATQFFAPALSVTFNGVLTANDFVREIDGVIEFTSDCTVTFRWKNDGNAVVLRRGSFVRLLLIEPT